MTNKNPIIWQFLLQYKEMVREWVNKNLDLYKTLRENEDQAYEQYKVDFNYPERLEVLKKWHGKWADYHFELEFRSWYYRDIHQLTKDVYTHRVDLNKYLDKDIESRYNKLIKQISKYTGSILDAKLIIKNGELNGLIIGENGKATVNTITAGGYNIQCFHFRTLVKEVK